MAGSKVEYKVENEEDAAWKKSLVCRRQQCGVCGEATSSVGKNRSIYEGQEDRQRMSYVDICFN